MAMYVPTDEEVLRDSYRELRSARATLVASKQNAMNEMQKYGDMLLKTDAAMAEIKLKIQNSEIPCTYSEGHKCSKPELWLESCGKCIIGQEVRSVENERLEMAMSQADNVSFDQ